MAMPTYPADLTDPAADFADPTAKVPVPPEVVEWAKATYDEQEVEAGMAEIRAGRGCSIGDLLTGPTSPNSRG